MGAQKPSGAQVCGVYNDAGNTPLQQNWWKGVEIDIWKFIRHLEPGGGSLWYTRAQWGTTVWLVCKYLSFFDVTDTLHQQDRS